MTGEFSTARGAIGTVMRHFLHTRVFAAPAPVPPCVFQYTAIAMNRTDSVCSHTERESCAGSGEGEKGNRNDGMPSAAESHVAQRALPRLRSSSMIADLRCLLSAAPRSRRSRRLYWANAALLRAHRPADASEHAKSRPTSGHGTSVRFPIHGHCDETDRFRVFAHTAGVARRQGGGREGKRERRDAFGGGDRAPPATPVVALP